MDQQHQQLHGTKGLHPRRLSSTPIKSPPRVALQRCSIVGRSGVTVFKSSSVNSAAFVAKVIDNTLKDKVSIENEEDRDSGREEKPENCDVSSCGGSEFEVEEVTVKAPMFPSVLCFPAPSNPPYDKRSYQDEDSCRDSASDVTQGDEEESDSVLSNTEDSTLLEDKEGRQGRVVFDDDDTWNDLEVTPIAIDSRGASPVSKETASRMSPPERTMQRKVAVTKVVDLDMGTVTSSVSHEPDPPPPPPASQLMTRLFPSLKPKTLNAPLPPSAVTFAASESRKVEEETGETNDCRRFNVTTQKQSLLGTHEFHF